MEIPGQGSDPSRNGSNAGSFNPVGQAGVQPASRSCTDAADPGHHSANSRINFKSLDERVLEFVLKRSV